MVRCLGCNAVNAAGVSTCRQCGAALGTVCTRCGAGNPAFATFCCGCAGRLDSLPDSGAPTSLDKAEHRLMTVLFCDLVDSTQLSRALDAEDWHGLLNRVHSRCGEIIAKHYGHVAQYLGDGLLAYFGYPFAAQDDARRAVTAALELAREGSRLGADSNQSIRFRVGIHTGTVVVGNIGSGRHQEFLALGETPNLAARIQDLAPADSVVVSADTQRLVEGFFHSTKLGVFVPKGFPDPLTLYRMLDASGHTTRLEAASVAGLTPLVGRDSEAVAMAEAWDLALANQAPVVLLQGEAGIGKSRLIHLLREQLESQNVRLIELRCSEHTRSSAFHPAIDNLRRQAGLRASGSADEILAQLGQCLKPAGLSDQQILLIASLFGVRIPPSEALSPQPLRAALLDALCAWVLGAHERRPTLFVVEDMHWVDPSTLELVAALVGRPPPPTAILTVLTARPEFTPAWPAGDRVRTLALRRLAPDETRRLVTLVAKGKPLPAEIIERVAARAEGIPLFLEEMTKAIVETDGLREIAGGSHEPERSIRESRIPSTLQGSLMGRFDQLGRYKPIAQVAAVLGREFSGALFEAVWRRLPSMPDIDLTAGLARVAAAQLITLRDGASEPTYQFKHSLLQKAAYESLLRSVRRDCHRQTAEVLLDQFGTQAQFQPELVAYHYAAAQMDERAVQFWGKAGEHAVASSAYAEAIAHFNSALGHLAVLPATQERSRREMELRVSLGVALITTRGYAAQDVADTYGRAAELCGELGSELPLRVLYGVWGVNLVRSDLTSVQRMVLSFERLAKEARDSESALLAHATLATWAFWRGNYRKVATHHAALLPLYDNDDPKKQHEKLFRDHGFEGLVQPQLYFAWSQAITGDTSGGLRCWREAAAFGERTGDPYINCVVLAFGAALNHDLGNFSAAGELAARVREIDSKKAFFFWLTIASIVHGHVLVMEGMHDAGIAKIKEGLTSFRGAGVKTCYSYYLCYLAEAYLATARFADALDVLGEALEMTRTNVDRNYEPEMLRLLGEALLAQGQLDAARESFLRAVELSRAEGARLLELRATTSFAGLLRFQGETDRAKHLLSDVRASFIDTPDLQPLRVADELLLEL